MSYLFRRSSTRSLLTSLTRLHNPSPLTATITAVPHLGTNHDPSFRHVIPPHLHFGMPTCGIHIPKPSVDSKEKSSVDRTAYYYTLKETKIPILDQSVTTMDNIRLIVDGVLYVKISDPELSPYGTIDPTYVKRAMLLVGKELRKISSKETFETFFWNDNLNKTITETVNFSAEDWGLECLRYKITGVREAEANEAREMAAEDEDRESDKRFASSFFLFCLAFVAFSPTYWNTCFLFAGLCVYFYLRWAFSPLSAFVVAGSIVSSFFGIQIFEYI